MSQPDADAEPTVKYQFSMDRETWREWANGIPRSQSLERQIQALIEQDLKARKRAASGGEIETETVGLLATRIRIRSMQAIGGVRDGDEDGLEKALSELEDIVDLANALVE